jgi:hypothetical protein
MSEINEAELLEAVTKEAEEKELDIEVIPEEGEELEPTEGRRRAKGAVPISGRRQKILKFAQMKKYNDLKKLECQMYGIDCDSVKTETELKTEAGYNKGYSVSDVKKSKFYLECMEGWEAELQKRRDGNGMLDDFDKRAMQISTNSQKIANLSNDLLMKGIMKRLTDEDFIEKLSALDFEKLANVAAKSTKTAHLSGGKSTENHAHQVEFVLSGDDKQMIDIFSQQDKNKQDKRESVFAAMEAED